LKEGNTLRKRKQPAKLVKFEIKKKGLDTRMRKERKLEMKRLCVTSKKSISSLRQTMREKMQTKEQKVQRTIY
jgi:hypothetical protein